MKSKIVLTVLCAMFSIGLMAQMKIGYTNVEYVLSLMPEAKQIETELATYEKQLSTQLQAKYQEFQTKGAAYQENAATYNDVQRTDKEKELQNLQASIQEFEVNAQNSLVNKRNELLGPAFEKIGIAIEEVSKENGYSHVFNMTAGGQQILLYAREEENVTSLVLKKLGIDAPAAE